MTPAADPNDAFDFYQPLLESGPDLLGGWSPNNMSTPVLRAVVAMAVCGLLLAREHSPPPTPSHADGCKPSAPVRIDEVSSRIAGGELRLEYTVTPLVEAAAITSSWELPRGARLVREAPIGGALGAAAGQGLAGSGRITGARGVVELRVRLTFVAGADDDLETAIATRRWVVGDLVDPALPRVARKGRPATLEVPTERVGGRR